MIFELSFKVKVILYRKCLEIFITLKVQHFISCVFLRYQQRTRSPASEEAQPEGSGSVLRLSAV